MAEKKKNDIIEDQRRARQEFINLKKMQQGEMYAGPKPSETATVLKTPKDKFLNFWHYSKWYVLGVIASIVLIVFMVAQCATKPVYDMKVVYFTYTPALDDQTTSISDYLKKYCEDVNGDGEVNIQIINCSVSNESNNINIRNAAYQKLQAVIVAEESAMLFITDSKSATYFDNMSSETKFFDSNTAVLTEEFYAATESEAFGKLPEGLSISCRNIGGTIMDKKDEASKYYDAAQNIINSIKSPK